ncbi:MAG: glycosyltransferase [Desulfobacterales bacterium]|nr:glycosyltransferase [Desulfobacterales bacterium]
MDKHWLILAHCFNMDGRAASQTITDRIPYLLDRAVTPVVLSAPTGTKDDRFPHARVLSPAPSGIIFELRHIIKNKIQNNFARNIFKGLITLILLPFYIIEKIFIHLDSHWSWFLSAFPRSFFLIKKFKPRIIYSTAGPSSTHVTAFLLKKYFKLPWVAEIHDPLIYDEETKKNQRYKFNKCLEKKIFSKADAIIYFTDNALKNAVNRNFPRENTYVIRPGANPPGIANTPYQKRKRLHFGYFGSLTGSRNLCGFIQALYELTTEKPEWKHLLCLDTFGCNLDAASRECLNRYPLDDIISVHGRLEHDPLTNKSGRQQVIEAMRQSDVLLLVHGSNDRYTNEYIPSKLYEYLLTNRPVLGIAAKNSELETILQNEHHHVINGTNVTDIKQQMSDLIRTWEKSDLPDLKPDTPYTVDKAVDQLFSIIKNVS